MRRLYIGGLSHTVTQKDLKDRFGKFGDVEDVELRTRRDDEGLPYKTFGYININISDADLKKCLTVLNKSKWKGGTLQIETAKESFLHRLAEERQEAEEQRLKPRVVEDKRQKMLDSLSKAGVENFTMKAAVPGTEVPGHKDWIVSKFGRVLPVLQLRCQQGRKARTLKYDPSKYSHNIRRLDRTTEDQHTSVTQLTWELQGGDDDISKKRRGEFPPFEPLRPKKSRTDMVNSHNALGRTRLKQTVDSADSPKAHSLTNGYEPTTNHRLPQRTGSHFPDSDVDSDEEIRRMVAAQDTSHVALGQEDEEDNLEVVGLDYFVKSGCSCQQQKDDYDSADTDELLASRKPPPPLQEKLTLPAENHLSGNDTKRKRKVKKKRKAGEEEEDSSDDEDHLTSKKPPTTLQKEDPGKKSSQSQSKKTIVPPVMETIQLESDSGDDEDDEEEEVESSDDGLDSDYEAMFSNVTHLEISLTDLQKIAEEAQKTETTTPSILSSSSGKATDLKSSPPAPKKGIMPEDILASLMEDSSEEEQKKKKKKKRKAMMTATLPAFQGTRGLDERFETEECQRGHKAEDKEEESRVKKQKLDSEATQLNLQETDSKKSRTLSIQKCTETKQETSESSKEEEKEEEKRVMEIKTKAEVSKEPPAKVSINKEKAEAASSSSSDDDEEEEEEEEEEEAEEEIEVAVKNIVPTPAVVNAEKTETSSSSQSDDEEEEEEETKAIPTVLTKVAAKASPSSSSSSGSSSEEEEDEQEVIPAKDALKASPPTASTSESSSSGDEEEEEGEGKSGPSQTKLGAKEEEERQREANLRRLAAVQQRQKETEEHKKLIQGALANLDAPAAGAGKHIVFGSDDEDEENDEAEKQQGTSDITPSKKTLFQDSQSEGEATGDEPAANEKKTVKEKKSSVPQLFGGSDDDEDSDEEEDGSRFEIRPQFEGKSGQKLMELQSRFGTDERFRMDSRFLEEDDEDREEESEKKMSLTEDDEALEEEKKKNLSILESIIGSSQQTCSKTAGKAKTFRDVSALHYDPSREEHAAFETKTEEVKESKAARRKKREEAQKLPEVSKEIYYDVSGDLKAVFGASKGEVAQEEEKTNWDQEEEDEKEEEGKTEQAVLSLLSVTPSSEKEESSGFKFSFFGDDAETDSKETEYKVERIQAPKVSWQQDPRFHDSSSEEEEEEQEEDEEQSIVAAKTTEEESLSTTDRFFFFPEDSRLTEGPKLFCQSTQLEEQREQWEERRTALRQEYRKKHKDARRKLKSSQKS
ncbi:nucleolar protein 8 isoform X2 [Cheilinus undulatus]|uniref:nucleolar protein 8 isoform X2 n=1 Tax=Cheilinus undulatus TaxID=241271 RepID=UPI001BD4DE59|nr:nucleolar protein 8 isoform X2 [Cheilinus undulatus]